METSLNAEQRAAVEHPPGTALRVIAGAGTGKTTLLTERFLYLVQHYGIAPDRVLCLTFTSKAAAHMRGKITRALIGEARDSTVGTLWIDTFHSIAWRVLSTDLLGAGLPTDTRLATPLEQAAMRKAAWQQVCHGVPDALQPTLGPRWENPSAIEQSVFNCLDSLSRDGIRTEEIETTLADARHGRYEQLGHMLLGRLSESKRFKGRADIERALPALDHQEVNEAATATLLSIVGEAYAQECDARHLLDFTGVLLRATAAVENSSTWQSRFDAILVDECQDTNGAQFRLLDGFAQSDYANVTVVGDRKQCIYAFQGARPTNLDRVTGTDIPLELNYRSVNPILEAAHAVIALIAPTDPQLRNIEEPHTEEREHPAVWFARLESETQEAEWIADEIVSLHSAGVPLASMAILVRTRSRLPAIQEALDAPSRRVPYAVVDKYGGWNREAIKTARALLRVACNPLDDLALIRLLQERPYALTLDELYQSCGQRSGESVFEMIQRSSSTKLQQCAKTVSELAALAGMTPPAEFLSLAMQQWGLLDDVLLHDSPGRLDFQAIAALYSTTAHAFAGSTELSLDAFLAAIVSGDLQLEHTDGVDELGPGQGVRISNIHQVKGLEFPVVFTAGLGVGKLPQTRAMRDEFFSYDDELGFAQRKVWTGKPETMARWEFDLAEKWHARQLQEERRLLYVAITRAQYRCYLTSHTPRADEKGHDPELHFVEALEDWMLGEVRGAAVLTQSEHPKSSIDDLPTAEARPPHAPAPSTDPEALSAQASEALERIMWQPPAELPHALELSYTQLHTFNQCPRLYKFRYTDQLPEPEHEKDPNLEEPGQNADYSTAELGTLVHTALEYVHGPEKLPWSDALDRCESSSDLHYRRRASELLERYEGWAIATNAEVVAVEQGFRIRLGELPNGIAVWLSGSIDRIDRQADDTLAIWDFKTGRLAADTGPYALQLQLYALAAETVLTTPVSQSGIIALGEPSEARGVWRDVDVSEQGLDRVRVSALTAAERIQAGEWESSAHSGRPCEKCRYAAICPDKISGNGTG